MKKMHTLSTARTSLKFGLGRLARGWNHLFQGQTGLVRDERGMSTVEYVILLAVIVVGAVSVWNQIGGNVKAKLGEANTELETMGN